MYKIKNIIKRCIGISLLILYLFASSFSLFHNHSEHNHSEHNHSEHNHSEHTETYFAYCESAHNELNHFSNCSHKEHLSKLKENCLLCNHFIIADYSILSILTDININFLFTNSFISNDKIFINGTFRIPNKSPPLLI